jgi:3-deoxy-D-manno-octulosonate 8-phosphate phosphatase (KDO 8-P phosphatase)
VQRSDIERDVARQITLVIFDVDGVLTDNGIYVGSGIELKKFNIQDGLGMKLLQFAGLKVAMVSGRISEATTVRAADLGVECFQANAGHKMEAVRTLMQKHGVAWNEIAWLGDDLPDMAPMLKAGLPAAVANCTAEIRQVAKFVTTKNGGDGAVREFAEALLKARGDWTKLVDEYVAERQ